MVKWSWPIEVLGDDGFLNNENLSLLKNLELLLCVFSTSTAVSFLFLSFFILPFFLLSLLLLLTELIPKKHKRTARLVRPVLAEF